MKLRIVLGLTLVSLLPGWASTAKAQSSIDSLEEIMLGGVRQWILLRGQDVENPILLFLHGGPGFPEMPFTHVTSPKLEEHFIVVHWDQRGAGKSYDVDIPVATMNIEQFLSDTKELIDLLKTRFSRDKILLVGESWGSILGLYTAFRYPESLFAYVGIGQVVHMEKGEMISYNYAVKKATEAGDEEAIGQLASIGSPPYEGGFRSLGIQRMILAKYGGSFRNISFADIERIRHTSPHYTEADNARFMEAFGRTGMIMWPEVMTVNFLDDVPEVQIPVYFFTGRCDYQVPFELVESYVETIKAPYKEIVWFENSCHAPNLDEPEVYQNRMINIVLRDLGRRK